MVAGEYLVQVISRFVGKEFGFVKVCFDVTLVLISCVLSLWFTSYIEGVREGTVIVALIVGPIAHMYKSTETIEQYCCSMVYKEIKGCYPAKQKE